MYPYTKRKDKNIAAKFAKDRELMYPIRNIDEVDEKHEAYIEDLSGKPDFVKTYKANDARNQESLAKTIANFSWKELLMVLFFTLSFGGVTYGVIKSEESVQTTKTQNTKNAAVALLAALIGCGIGTLSAVAFKQADRISSIDGFYNRLTIRYFNKLKKAAPDVFSEEVFKSCNPEMIRVVSAILMVNMPEKETKKIQKIALNVPYLHDDRDINTMRKIETDIKVALGIVEHCLLQNPELDSLIQQAYKGYIPSTFILQSENQKAK